MANRPLPPARISLETLTLERVELYAHIPPPGQHITIEVDPFSVDDNILGEEEIAKAVLWLQLHRAGGPSGMRAEHLRMWICAETQEEDPDPGNWGKVTTIIQASFRGE